MIRKCFVLLFGLIQLSQADKLHIDPYAQWTFDTPLERVIYRSNTNGFPIKFILTTEQVVYYDSLGNQLSKIDRTPRDVFKISEDHSHFMLIQKHESIDASNPQILHSFQVYDRKGDPEYTMVHGVEYEGGELNSSLTNLGSILLTREDESWILEMQGEDTLLYISTVYIKDQRGFSNKLLLDQLVNRNEFITASSSFEIDQFDTTNTINLHLWNHDKLLEAPVAIPGNLVGLEGMPGTDYYFLEIHDGFESTLTLFNRSNLIEQYPWKTWNITSLGKKAAFVVSESDFHVVNLGDGSTISSYHPIDMPTISDAEYLHNWGLFLYIRYEPFFTEAGQQAFRKFELEGVSKSGQIAHRSSFGSWTTSLPKIAQIGKDLFAIHMHNAVLLYRVKLEKE